MIKLETRSIPIKDILSDLAKAFDVTLKKNCHEYVLNIPNKFGTGFISGIDFKYGLGILIYDCTFNENIEIHFIENKVHPLKFLFCEKGYFQHRFESESTWHDSALLENIIVASPTNQGHIMKFEADNKVCITSLEVDRLVFEVNHDCEINSLSENLKTLFRDIYGKNSFYYHGDYCIKMANLFIEIREFVQENFLRRVFLEGSAYKLLTLQILQYDDDALTDHSKSILRKFELVLVQKASSIIDNNILDYSTVKELATEVGLNINKLQSGFKETYNKTINNYVHDRRLDLAVNLLKSTEFTISEVAYKIGLSSNSYFSKIFKEKYGVSPSEFREHKSQSK